MENKESLRGKKFAVAYSGGKDSVFAMYKAIELGMIPVVMIIMVDESNGRSWAHGMPESIQEQVEDCFGVPLIVVKSNNDSYAIELERTLKETKNLGAEYCVFGDLFDIPLEDNWNTTICRKAEIEPLYPLMGCDRKQLLIEFINTGFKTIINTVDTNILSEDFIGKTINSDLIEELEQTSADVCGENGEYHSMAIDGPIFKKPITINWGDKIRFTNVMGNYTYQIMI